MGRSNVRTNATTIALTTITIFSVWLTIRTPGLPGPNHFRPEPIRTLTEFCSAEAHAVDYTVAAAAKMSSTDPPELLARAWRRASDASLSVARLDPDKLNALWWSRASKTLIHLANDLPHLRSFIASVHHYPDPSALDSSSYGNTMLTSIHLVTSAEYNMSCQHPSRGATQLVARELHNELMLFARTLAFDDLAAHGFRPSEHLRISTIRQALAGSNHPELLQIVSIYPPNVIRFTSSYSPRQFCYRVNSRTPNLSRPYYWLGATVPCK